MGGVHNYGYLIGLTRPNFTRRPAQKIKIERKEIISLFGGKSRPYVGDPLK
jgi:hypothetical protein